MKSTIDSFNGLEMFFLASAVIGGFFILIRIFLQFIGAGAHGNADVHFNGENAVDSHHADSDLGFKFLSIHGLSTFLMMFGLIGLALYRQSLVGPLLSIAGSVSAGVLSVWMVAKLFKSAARLQSNGTLDTRDAVGATGTVYLTIPEKGVGQVNIRFKGRFREYDAMEKNGKKMGTGTLVKVVQVNNSILLVEKIE